MMRIRMIITRLLTSLLLISASIGLAWMGTELISSLALLMLRGLP